MAKYEIITGSNKNRFEIELNMFLSDGWQLAGNLQIQRSPAIGVPLFIVPIIKDRNVFITHSSVKEEVVIIEGELQEFKNLINSHLNNGWVLHGDLNVEWGNLALNCSQALIRYI